MSTINKTRPKRKQKEKQPDPVFVVFQDGVPCGFDDPTKHGLGYTLASGVKVVSRLVGARGVLMPGPPPFEFTRESFALTEVRRRGRIIDKFRGTMCDNIPNLQPLLQPATLLVRKLMPGEAAKMVPASATTVAAENPSL